MSCRVKEQREKAEMEGRRPSHRELWECMRDAWNEIMCDGKEGDKEGENLIGGMNDLVLYERGQKPSLEWA